MQNLHDVTTIEVQIIKSFVSGDDMGETQPEWFWTPTV